MNFEQAIRLTEILMGFAFIQQSIEHLISFSYERRLFLIRLLLSLFLILGYQTTEIIILLSLLSLLILQRFQGPYNGGADRMSLLILFCLTLVHIAPSLRWQELAFAYLALQLILSYFISGLVKVVNSDWRKGQALHDVFQFSAYPVSESLRQWANSPRILFLASWLVMVFELMFPFSLISNMSLITMLVITAIFHFSNACFFGLNRFFWIWIASYPSILWFQNRIFIIYN